MNVLTGFFGRLAPSTDFPPILRGAGDAVCEPPVMARRRARLATETGPGRECERLQINERYASPAPTPEG